MVEFQSLLELNTAIPDEQAAVAHFAAIRWKNGEFCPYCGHDRLYHFADQRTHKCAQCKARFSIKVGTIFEDTKLPLRTWMLAVWFITSHKKGIASTQLAKDLGVTQKTAWFMMHRLLSGDVEADECFIGGLEANKHTHKQGLKAKAVVMGLLERGGELRAFPVDTAWSVAKELGKHIAPGSRVLTDEYIAYRKAAKDAGLIHETVKHSRKEYARAGGVHCNSIEGYWSQLKRQINGIHHWVSRKHLGRYVSENVWRYNRRGLTEQNRFNDLLTATCGSRLTYPELIA